MPVRVRARAATAARDPSPISLRLDFDLPDITADDSFRDVVKKLSLYFTDVIELPSTFEQLRTTSAGHCLRVLVDHLSSTCTNLGIVNALLALKWHYAADGENKGLGEARSYACEIVAWRFLTRLSERDAVDFCLFEIPDSSSCDANDHEQHGTHQDEEAGELSPLLGRIFSDDDDADSGRSSRPAGSGRKRIQLLSSLSRLTNYSDDDTTGEADPTAAFKNLNALEIAAIANAKRFLSQHVVQKILTGIWNGDIVYWDSLSVHATKKPRYYNPRTMDPFSRLRVPKYLKCWEVLFFAGFLLLYYVVLIVRDNSHFTVAEVLLFFWIAAFFYDELSEWIDAGSVFYATDIWNLFDMVMILIGSIFAVLRIIGVTQQKEEMSELAFDVLALEALFMIPRICSILSLSPYWGTLIPCLKEMGKDFLKFMVLVVIIYLGFLTTFSLVGRDVFNLSKMTWTLTKIFYGSSSTGFDVMEQIDPVFGPPLMIIFITLSSILLTGSLTGMLSNSFSRVITHAREEYLYVYSVYVLEASTSNRLTHFYPPFNLIALILFRPWRFILRNNQTVRAGRIYLLKLTHFPIVVAIRLYEIIRHKVGDDRDEFAGFKGPSESKTAAAALRDRPGSSQLRRPLHSHRNPSSQNQVAQRPLSAPEPSRAVVEDDMDAPTNMEVQIGELNKKIDQLTAVVLAMQENIPASRVHEVQSSG